ncbi:MAG: protein-L-isoaspartate O-methyltransferase, partial [Calditrichaeota bacterium]|nr:protein-L-isoaspartate O-methyltransferase [Calditrichota bacterium]
QTLANQLGENGKLIVPVGDKVQQKLMIVTRQGNNFDIIEADSRSFVPLIGKRGWAD